jgi:hypothetical protein
VDGECHECQYGATSEVNDCENASTEEEFTSSNCEEKEVDGKDMYVCTFSDEPA